MMKMTRAQDCASSLAALGALVLVMMTLGFACTKSPKPAAGLEVLIATDMRTPEDFDSLEVKVSQETSTGVFGTALFDDARSVPGSVTLPTTVSIAAGSNPDQLARIVVRGLKGNVVVVERTAQVQVPTDRLLEFEVFLASACANVAPCGDMTTCIGGACQSIIITPSQLQPYQPADQGGGGPGGGNDGATGSSDGPGPADAGVPGCSVTCSAGYCMVTVGGGCGCIASGAGCPNGGVCTAGACTGGSSADASIGGCGLPGQTCCATGPQCTGGACQTEPSPGGCQCVSQGSRCGPSAGPMGTCNSGTCSTSSGLCSPSNCPGCCDSTGRCFAGNMPSACGTAGGYCQTCLSGSTCNGSTCSFVPCGQPGQPCCTNGGGGPGGCNGQASCVSGSCVACGQVGQTCCGVIPPGNCSGMNLSCNTSFKCVSCGGLNQPCCGGNFCSGPGLMCNGTTCAPQCGLTGNACCPYNQCNQGCCENGTCTGQGSTCVLYGGICANQACQGNTCGSYGQPCCMTAGGALGCTNSSLVCRSGTCQGCGMTGPSGSNGNCCPGDFCQMPSSVCSHASDAGTGGDPDGGYCVLCGGYQQPCCDPDAGHPGLSTPCQTGYACAAGTCI